MGGLDPAGAADAARLGQLFQCAPVDLDHGVPLDIYELFAEVTGREYNGSSHSDELTVLEYAAAFERAAGCPDGPATKRRVLAQPDVLTALLTYTRQWQGGADFSPIDTSLTIEEALAAANNVAAGLGREIVISAAEVVEVLL